MTQRPNPDRDPSRRVPIRLERGAPIERPDPTDGPFAIERLSVLTHELRNLLDGSIRCLGLARRSLAMLPREVEGARDASRNLDTAQTALERMADLINAAMRGTSAVVGSAALAPERPITLEEGIRHAMDVLTPFAQDRRVRLALSIDHATGAAPVGPMYAVVLNGIKNAIEAIPEGHEGCVEVSARFVADEAAARDGIRFILIAIQDDGSGLSGRGVVDRVFDFGFTTKQPGRGIGLALSREIIRNAGGSIELSQRSDRSSADRPGAALRVLYPIVSPSAPAAGG